MRLSLVSLSLFPLLATAHPTFAQQPRQLEFSALVGTAHTDHLGRLGAEQPLEPFKGLRLDARLFSIGGGRAGVMLAYDRYDYGTEGRVTPACRGICALSVPGPDGLVAYKEGGTDKRLAIAATWQRPIFSLFRLDVAAIAGSHQTSHAYRYDDEQYQDDAPRRAFVGAETGVSAQWHALIAGVGMQIGGGRQDVRSGNSSEMSRRVQHRVAFRLGYALPLGGSR